MGNNGEKPPSDKAGNGEAASGKVIPFPLQRLPSYKVIPQKQSAKVIPLRSFHDEKKGPTGTEEQAAPPSLFTAIVAEIFRAHPEWDHLRPFVALVQRVAGVWEDQWAEPCATALCAMPHRALARTLIEVREWVEEMVGEERAVGHFHLPAIWSSAPLELEQVVATLDFLRALIERLELEVDAAAAVSEHAPEERVILAGWFEVVELTVALLLSRALWENRRVLVRDLLHEAGALAPQLVRCRAALFDSSGISAVSRENDALLTPLFDDISSERNSVHARALLRRSLMQQEPSVAVRRAQHASDSVWTFARILTDAVSAGNSMGELMRDGASEAWDARALIITRIIDRTREEAAFLAEGVRSTEVSSYFDAPDVLVRVEEQYYQRLAHAFRAWPSPPPSPEMVDRYVRLLRNQMPHSWDTTTCDVVAAEFAGLLRSSTPPRPLRIYRVPQLREGIALAYKCALASHESQDPKGEALRRRLEVLYEVAHT